VVAATSQSMLKQLTKAAQEAELQGAPRGFDFDHVPLPWPEFREDTRAKMLGTFVSRAERRRARGEAHAATIKQVREIEGKAVVFERKAVEKLTLADLENIPVPEPYGKIGDPAKLRDEMVAELRRWIEAGKPKDALPRSPKGDVIRKMRVRNKDKIAVEVRGGTADRGDMARVDVFAKADKRGRQQYYLVPIYPHQVADRNSFPNPPDRAVDAHKLESEWTAIDQTFSFLYSLNQNSLIEVTKSDGEVIFGYFKGLDRDGGQIAIAMPESQQKVRGRIGSRTLLRFRKLSVSRLGRFSETAREVRTWHGEACT